MIGTNVLRNLSLGVLMLCYGCDSQFNAQQDVPKDEKSTALQPPSVQFQNGTHPASKLATKQAICVLDSSQTDVCMDHHAMRVVSLFESALDGLYMLQQGHKVVGIPAEVYLQPLLYQAYSKLDPRIAAKQLATPSQGANATNIESLVLLKPDLVIVGSGQTQTIDLLRKFHIAVYVMESSTYAQVKEELAEIAILTGAEARANQLLRFADRELAKVAANTAKQANKESIYYAWSGGRIFSTSGRQSITNDFIELAGAVNILKTDASQPNVNPETLIEWNPDNIVLWNSDPELIYQREELQQLKAVRTHQVFNLTPAFIYNPHTIKIIVTAISLNHSIYPDSADLPVATLQLKILTELYGEAIAKALMS
ncbi:iron complex transport system substrate-binding protein [Acinetobacter marinus]|uniref:Iron complex transport system substrate-binding protein n=1 Tax=Acinetobacter marinus TaxID=281375 RepID=A0A1G6P563_9GAMM|nr:iron complex transport system substrate-binding protein [Acinetobacter marinus]